MNVVTGLGIALLCIALIYKYKPKNTETKEIISIDEIQRTVDEKTLPTKEIVTYHESEETKSDEILKQLKEINQTLSFFKDIITIIIIFIVVKYIVIAIFFQKSINVFTQFINKYF